MSIKRNNPKRDNNEIVITEGLKYAGAFVTRLSDKGVPDLLVGFHGVWYLMEVKADKGRLTKSQIDWHGEALNAGCKVHIVYSLRDALLVIGAIDEG